MAALRQPPLRGRPTARDRRRRRRHRTDTAHRLRLQGPAAHSRVLVVGPAGDSGRDEAPVGRVPEAITNLFDHYEAHGTAVLRMLSQEERIPAIQQMTDAGRAYHRAWAAKTFAPLLRGLRGGARERRLIAIVVATDLLVWKLLRHDMRLERAEAERITAEIVQSAAR